MEITRSILTEAAQRPWLAALLMRRRPGWLTRLVQLAQRVRDLPRHTRRALRRKLASGLAAAALLLALTGASPAYAADIAVNGDGTGSTCSLPAAIINANEDNQNGSVNCTAGSGADTIILSTDVSLTEAMQSVTTAITIEGNNHTIQRTGSGPFSVLTVLGPNGNLTLNQATISNGLAAPASPDGGGINNSFGVLTVRNSTISGNTASNGGGIVNAGTATALVQNSTLSGNTATSNGGGIYNGGTLTVQNSTLSGNRAITTTGYVVNGGGIGNGGLLTVTNSTIFSNTAAVNNINSQFVEGGGIYTSGTATVQNSIVAGNTVISNTATYANDCYSDSTPFTSGGYNIESAESCGFDPTAGKHDQWDVDNTTLKLDPTLAKNGSNPHPFTHALLVGSVAIDKIPTTDPSCTAGVSTDERGGARASDNVPFGKGLHRGGSACDIGAFEYDSNQTPNAVTMHDLTAAANTAPGAIGAVGAAFAALSALWVGRRRLKVR